VGSLISLAVETVEKLTDDWEVIIVDDGSLPANSAALNSIVEVMNYSRLRIIHHERNKGYGGALRTGFSASKKDLIFYTDCDAQYDPRELTKLYEVMRRGEVGMVNGYKIKRNDPWYRVVAGRVYHYLVKFAFDLPVRDTDCDFRLVKREVFDPSTHSTGSGHKSSGRIAVRLFENTGTICVELVKKVDHAGYKIEEVPVHHFWRTSGKSQFFNFKRLFKTGVNLLRLWWKLIIKKDYNH